MQKLLLRQEKWATIVGFNGLYEISNYGQLRSLRHRYGLRKIPLIMALSKNNKGYLQKNLWKDGVGYCKKIHRLVLESFIGPCPTGFEGSHRDGNNQNNFVDNLVWESPLENSKRKFVHGTVLQGENNPPAKLNRLLVSLIKIKHKIDPTISQRTLGNLFGVSHTTIYGVLNGVYWK